MTKTLHLLSPYDTPSLRVLVNAYQKAGAELRFVGGIVRDSLIGRHTSDIDLATPLAPEQGLQLLKDHGIKVIPTGIDFGTITAVIDGQPYEITTLRRDVETNGRHAIVSYTSDWQQDAARRDFTINALYADLNGTLYDYFNGAADLKQGIVRFIGNAEDRIQEDYLRIIRLFRFHAWYGHGNIDAATLATCRQHKQALTQLSIERVTKEILKLLLAPSAVNALTAMQDAEILSTLFSQNNFDAVKFSALESLEHRHNLPISNILRLALVITKTKDLRLSLKDAEAFTTITSAPLLTEKNLHLFLYHHGQPLTLNTLAYQNLNHNQDNASLMSLTQATIAPAFPLSGKDLLDLGIAPGKAMGDLLKDCLAWWCTETFRPSKEECLVWVRKKL